MIKEKKSVLELLIVPDNALLLAAACTLTACLE